MILIQILNQVGKQVRLLKVYLHIRSTKAYLLDGVYIQMDLLYYSLSLYVSSMS